MFPAQIFPLCHFVYHIHLQTLVTSSSSLLMTYKNTDYLILVCDLHIVKKIVEKKT